MVTSDPTIHFVPTLTSFCLIWNIEALEKDHPVARIFLNTAMVAVNFIVSETIRIC